MTTAADLLAEMEGGQAPQADSAQSLLAEIEGPQQSLPEQGLNVLSEAASAINRGVTNVADFLTTDQVNAILSLAGSDKRVPSITEMLSSATEGGQMQPGLIRDVIRTGGEMVGPGAAGGALLRGAAKLLPGLNPASVVGKTASKVMPQAIPGESAAIGTIRSLGAGTTAGADIIGAAASGAGAEIGEEVAGPAGAMIGGVAAPTAVFGARALVQRAGRVVPLLDDAGVPTPEFQASLKRRGLDIGDAADFVSDLPVNVPARSTDELVDKMVKTQLAKGSKNSALAEIRLEGPNIVSDKLGSETVKQGFKKGDVAAAKGASQSTRAKMQDMLRMHREIFADSSKVDQFRPSDVPGKELLKRFRFIRSKTNDFNNQLKDIATKKMAGKQIDYDSMKDRVINELNELDIFVPDQSATDIKSIQSWLNTKEAFDGSIIKDDPTSRSMIKRTLSILSDNISGDAPTAHKQKKRIDTYVNWNKARTTQGYAGKGEDFAKNIRRGINEELRDLDGEYALVNDELTRAITTMDDFQKAMGTKINLQSENADQAIGQELRKLLSQYKVRQQLQDAVNQIDDTARHLGADFDVDVKELNRFATVLDNRFGSVADTSFQNKVTAAVKLAQESKGKTSIDIAADLIEFGVKKSQNINDPEAFNSMQRLLKRGK